MKCTARTDVAPSDLAYWSARLAARSRPCTSTRTVCRRSGRTFTVPGNSSRSVAASSRYSLLSRISPHTSSGKTTTTIQAPSVNLVMAKIRTTENESTAAVPLMTSLRRHMLPRTKMVAHHAGAGHGSR